MAKAVYLLQNETAGYVGDSPLFWKEGGCGYTAEVDKAKRFTWQEAGNVIRSTRGTHRWKRWKLSDVEKATIRVVDAQLLRCSRTQPKQNGGAE